MISPTRVARAFTIINGLPNAVIFSDRLKDTMFGDKKVVTRSIKIWAFGEKKILELAEVLTKYNFGYKIVVTRYGRTRIHVYSVED